jgi:hypothetical protein
MLIWSRAFEITSSSRLQSLGSNFVTIQPGSAYGLFGSTTKQNDLLEPYLYDSVSRLPYVDAATADRQTFGTINYMGEQATVIVVVTEPGYFKTMKREMLVGETLTSQDTFNAVLADSAQGSFKRRAFVLMSNFDLTVTVNGKNVTQTFRVKGVVKALQPDIGMGIIYVPIITLNSMMGDKGYTAITLTTSNVKYIDTIKVEAQQMLDRLLKVRPEQFDWDAGADKRTVRDRASAIPIPDQTLHNHHTGRCPQHFR